MFKYSDFVKVCVVAALVLGPVANAQKNPSKNSKPANSTNSKNGNSGNPNGSNGNTNNGNPGCQNGCTGNNGNGVGNTGPGNQGNDGSNGNAGGTKPGNGNGGSNGGGNNGGGNNGGGNNGGGNNGGGNNGGGNNGGGNNGGGNNGGGHNGGGTTTGGETTGGSTTGGDTTGGDEGGSTGGDEGGSTGGNTDEPKNPEEDEVVVEETPEQEKAKKKFKARLLPLVYGNYDIQTKTVNLTEHDRDILASGAESYPVVLDSYLQGFQVTQIKMWDAGLGVMPQVYLENATGLAQLATGLVGLAMTKNRFVQYDRFVDSSKDLGTLKSLPLPFKKKQLDSYKVGESVQFENMGGILFFGGVGVAGVYAGGSVVAEGGFKTFVMKTDNDKAMVQIAKASLRSTSLYTGVSVIKLDGTKVNQLNEGFHYEFDFRRGAGAVKAYEALISGNMMIAQELSKIGPTAGVVKINSFTNREVTSRRSTTVGIPMVAIYNWSSGKTYGETASKFFQDNTTTDLNYGIYFKEQKGRFFHKHKKMTRSFYSAKAITKDADKKVLARNEQGTYFWSYESDNGTSAKLKDAVGLFHRDLGLKANFNPTVESKEKLGFIRLEAKVEIPESYTQKLRAQFAKSNKALNSIEMNATNMIHDYVDQGDAEELCRRDEDDVYDSVDACKRRLISESRRAINTIRTTLGNLHKNKTAKEYTYHYALLGKELVKNQFVLNSFFSLDDSCEVKYEVKLDGHRVSKMVKKIPANVNCR